MKKEKLIKYIMERISECKNRSEDLIQEYGDEEGSDKMIAMIAAYKDVIKFIQNNWNAV